MEPLFKLEVNLLLPNHRITSFFLGFLEAMSVNPFRFLRELHRPMSKRLFSLLPYGRAILIKNRDKICSYPILWQNCALEVNFGTQEFWSWALALLIHVPLRIVWKKKMTDFDYQSVRIILEKHTFIHCWWWWLELCLCRHESFFFIKYFTSMNYPYFSNWSLKVNASVLLQ